MQFGNRGQEQRVSYQAEERYWTDYLRIALPIAGLLLLLGVFWYWATSFIGDDTDNNPTTPEAAVVTTPITADTPTPTQGTAIEITPMTVEPTPTVQAEPTQAVQTDTTTNGSGSDPTATGAPPGDFKFISGDVAIVNDDNVNMRSEPSLSGSVVDALVVGTEVEILTDEPTEADGYVWWNVRDILSESEGWVAEDFVDPR
jgi:hypothetical protein